MKRPAGIVLISGLLLLAGLRLLGHSPTTPKVKERAFLLVIGLALGALSIVTATALWQSRPHAFRSYIVWSVAWLVGGAVFQFVAERAPLSHILIWWVFMGATLGVTGLYLRSELRRTV